MTQPMQVNLLKLSKKSYLLLRLEARFISRVPIKMLSRTQFILIKKKIIEKKLQN